MATPTIIDLNAAVQADQRASIARYKEQRTPTLNSFKEGRGAESGKLAGLEIPFEVGTANGNAALDPFTGATSFNTFKPSQTDKMFVGAAFTGFTVQSEWYHEADAQRGKLPEGEAKNKTKALLTYLQWLNWCAIGKGDGSLAVVTSGGSSGTWTFASDGTARGRSKGSLRLQISPNGGSDASRRILYDTITPSTGAVSSTFYITSRAAANTAVVVATSGSSTANDIVVLSGTYNRVPYGLGTHIDDTARIYQGANTAVHTFLNSLAIPANGSAISPVLIDDAKLAMEIQGNDAQERKNRVFHMTNGHFRELAATGYTLRSYNAEKGGADTTYGVPRKYEDEDSVWIMDEHGEDAFVYGRRKKDYFRYVQKELSEVTTGREQYAGVNNAGSTEFHRNFGEASNIAWDGRGEDGKYTPNGSANSSVVIKDLAMPALRQYTLGRSLV